MGTIPDAPGPAPESRRDADLAVAAASGDREALAAIYDRYAPRVFALAARRLRDRDAAADVTQDVFLTAAQRIGGLTDPERLRPWIFAVARHRIVDHVRSSRRVVPTDTIEDLDMTTGASGEGGDGYDRVRGAELRVLLADSSSGLDDRDRTVLELAYGAELSGHDLADALGVKENTAHQLLSRARQRLRSSVGALLVARQGRQDCDELAAVLEPWDGTFSTVWRKRVARHVDACEVCSDTERRVLSPAALGAAFPVLLVPEEVRAQVLAGLDLVSAPAAGRGADSWRPDGFPPEESDELVALAAPAADPTPRRTVGILLAVAGVALVGILGAWWGSAALTGDDLTVGQVGAAAAEAPSTTASTSTSTSTPGTASTEEAPSVGGRSEGSTDASRTVEPPTTARPTTAGATTADVPPVDPAPVLLVNPAGPLRLSRSGTVGLTVSHTGNAPAAVTVSVPDGFAADPAVLDVGAGGFVDVTVRWVGSPNEQPPPMTVVLEAPGFERTAVDVQPFRAVTPTTGTPSPPAATLVLPSLAPPVLAPAGPD